MTNTQVFHVKKCHFDLDSSQGFGGKLGFYNHRPWFALYTLLYAKAVIAILKYLKILPIWGHKGSPGKVRKVPKD